jgi:hypothetical protein
MKQITDAEIAIVEGPVLSAAEWDRDKVVGFELGYCSACCAAARISFSSVLNALVTGDD